MNCLSRRFASRASLARGRGDASRAVTRRPCRAREREGWKNNVERAGAARARAPSAVDAKAALMEEHENRRRAERLSAELRTTKASLARALIELTKTRDRARVAGERTREERAMLVRAREEARRRRDDAAETSSRTREEARGHAFDIAAYMRVCREYERLVASGGARA